MKIMRDLFTGADGQTWAIGRVYSAPMLISGLATPFFMVANNMPIDLAGLAILFPAVGAAVMALVTGTHSTEPKGPNVG
jgi:hypothetical protein